MHVIALSGFRVVTPSSHPMCSRAAALVAFFVTLTAAPLIAAPSAPVGKNPLRGADEATRAAARTTAWTTFQRSCRPCHGSVGGADGPYAFSFPQKAADLRHPSRDVASDAVRFARIRDGAATLGDQASESSMPAFGDDLDASAIWGLVSLLEDFGKEGSGLEVDVPGAEIYAARCAVCHGATGQGDGPLSAELLPPPTNFVHGEFRLRSTEYGEPPLDSDIIGATAKGVGDTSMGRFLTLGSDRLDALTKYVMSLSPKITGATPKTISGAPMPAISTAKLAARGRDVYAEAKCAECHGATGRGDGPRALDLKDDEGHPSIATDLTLRWKFKLGATPADVFRTLLAGLNGTEMKSYTTTLSTDDRWALAYYIDYIARPRPRYAPTVHTALVTEELPHDASDPFWKTLLPTMVAMTPQVEIAPYWTEPAIDMVEVAAAANDHELAILLIWDDRSRSVRNDEPRATKVADAIARYGHWGLTDAIAVQFPAKIDPKVALPPSFLGDGKRAVHRWYWSAERQERAEPALVERFAGPRSTPEMIDDDGTVRTTAAYADGQWRVVMFGKRPPKTLAKLPIALQAWDGASGEAGTWQSYSAWVNVDLR